MANQIAKNMSLDEKDSLESMDMNEMISHVTKNVLGMMNEGGLNGLIPPVMQNNLNDQVNKVNQVNQKQSKKVTIEETDSDSEENCIYAKTRDICFDLNVDLEDFYNGKKKKLNVKRKRMIEIDGKQQVIEEKKKLIIPIERGMKDEQQIRFEGEADQIPGYKPGDIIVTLIENEHPHFHRDGDNLIMTKNINLYQCYDLTFDIKHLDGTIIRISNETDALHLNDSIRKISNMGMPCYKSNSESGDLFIRFNLVIPKSLSQAKLELLKNIFEDDELFIENKLNESYDALASLENVSDADLEELEYSDTDDDSEETEEETEEESEESTEEIDINEVSSDDSGESEESS